jgi:hypothetical protein
MCGTALLGGRDLESNRGWIRDVGQDLYDAHGFGALQEMVRGVSAKYPMLLSQLSAILDGVGGWAD